MNQLIIIIAIIVFCGISLSCSSSEKKQQEITEIADIGSNASNANKDASELLGKYVKISPGEYLMGSDTGSGDEKPRHKVAISREFEMGETEITQAQWEAVTGHNPSNFKGANLPVENVSWSDVQAFIKKVNEKSKKYLYRLSTEAEWEYACRAGSTGDYAGDLDAMAWYRSNSSDKTHPVGQKQANAWGLYDMHGNVYEWCSDWYGSYVSAPVTDPSGAASGTYHVFRGGSWYYAANSCRSSLRYSGTPDFIGSYVGFRLVRNSR